ncbi:adenosine receptor A2b-like [Amphiura filiformis]|uniref:adenosine receptor A2b-like n=1 Tax=Amphiura filiformis TaxID=82378 RepID=UPI003B20BB53
MSILSTKTVATLNLTEVLNSTSADLVEDDLFFFKVFIFGMLLPLAIFILFGNALVIGAVREYNHGRQRAVYSFVGSLAFNDCLVGFVLIPVYYTAIFIVELKTNFYFCLTVSTFVLASCSTSMLHVSIIAVDRYLAIYFPLQYHVIMDSRKIAFTILVTWCISFIISVFPFMGWKNTTRKLDYCYIDQVVPVSYMSFHFTFSFVLPLIVTFAIYLQIIEAARHQIRRIGVLNSMARNGNAAAIANAARTPESILKGAPSSSDLKAITTTATVLGAFVLCYSPTYIALFVLYSLNHGREEPIRVPEVTAVFNLLAYANAAVNPVIYCFRYRDFRRSLKVVILKMLPRWMNKPRRKRSANHVEAISMDQVTINPSSVFMNHDFGDGA